MNLFILRHAIAKDAAGWGGQDRDRPLTSEGERKLHKTARGMKRLGISFDWILTSPYKRAYDTAEIVAKTFKARKKLRVAPGLTSDRDPAHLLKDLARRYKPTDSLLLVGHEPYLTRMISILVGAKTPLALDLKKGGLGKLTAGKLRYGRCASLEWFLPPKILAKIAK